MTALLCTMMVESLVLCVMEAWIKPRLKEKQSIDENRRKSTRLHQIQQEIDEIRLEKQRNKVFLQQNAKKMEDSTRI